MDRLMWTGDNVVEMVRFATGNGFGFTVGSPYHNYRWWHEAYAGLICRLPYCIFKRLPDWKPPEDITVLEVYPDRESKDEGKPWHWTTARPGDWLCAGGIVERGTVESWREALDT